MDLNLVAEGIQPKQEVHWNLTVPVLYEEAIKRSEGQIARSGALVVLTGEHTGRAPKDRFIVKESSTEDVIDWGPVNQPISEAHFDQLHRDITGYMSSQELFVQDLEVCSHPDYVCGVRVVTEMAWHSIFARNLFITHDENAPRSYSDNFRVIYAPNFKATPELHGTNSGTVIALNLAKRLVLIAGTLYAGEMKKSIFTSLNFLLPEREVFPMHCSANVGSGGDVALFFGLSGTGKTTLSADPARDLIGDDEHGWHAHGVFNFEGGCYAKAIGLKLETEPEIFKASNRFGSILENVALNSQYRTCDFDDVSITENTRAAYPICHLEKVVPEGQGRVPSTIFLLTYDAFGVLPPISKLTREQAIYYFLLGYTAKVAGTEDGVKEPQTTFSSCFGAPFLPRRASEYGHMLGKKLDESGAEVWLLNTGNSGGSYGVGSRISLSQTRSLVAAAMSGQLANGTFKRDRIFSLDVPTSCPGVDPKILNPRACWSNPDEYDRVAGDLKVQFDEQMKKFDGP